MTKFGLMSLQFNRIESNIEYPFLFQTIEPIFFLILNIDKSYIFKKIINVFSFKKDNHLINEN